MQKSNKIRWSKHDEDKLNKTVRNFNAKINRLAKKDPSMKDYLPSKISKQDLKNSIVTRKDLNREINSIGRFLKRGSETKVTSKSGNTVTAWERKEVAYKVASVNRMRTIERKRIEQMNVTSQGKDTGLKRAEMGSERVEELKPKKFDFDKIKKGKEWDLFKKSVEKQIHETYLEEKYETFKENYIKAIYNVFGSRADAIADRVKQIDAKTVVDTFYSEQEASIDFMYDPIEMDFKADIVEEIWNNVNIESDE